MIAMSQWKRGPANLYFQTRRYFFWLRWAENALQIEAVNKNELTKCFRGELKAEEKVLKQLYQFLQIHSYRESLSDNKVDEISLIMTILDMSQEGRGYTCRLIFNDSIKEIKVEPYPVSETYFLTKKIEAMEFEKKNDRIMMAQFGTEIAKKMQEKDEDMKKTFAQQMQGMMNALANTLQKKLVLRDKDKEAEQSSQGLNMRKIEKKLKRKIKKQLKERKKQKRRRKSEKKKKRKERKKQKQRLRTLMQGGIVNSQQVPPNKIEVQEDSNENVDKAGINNLQNFPFHNQDPNNFLNVDADEPNGAAILSEQAKNKRKKEKYRIGRQQFQPLVVQPHVTSLNSMSKLRNRGADLTVPFPNVQTINIDSKRQKHDKKSKQKKKKEKKDKSKKKDKQKQKEVEQVQQIEQAGEKQFYKRLQQIRKVGDIDQVRIARINRLKSTLAPPKPPLNEVDEFNPNYNGEPRYKPFVGLNEYQALRPSQIFTPRMEEVSSACRKIPAIFREDIPSFKNFEVNGCVVRKLTGINYQQMVLDYSIPQAGKHVITMRLIESKRSYLWFGVLDIREKDRQESFNKKNCITFSFRTGHVATSNKWSRSKVGRIDTGLSVRMEVDMDKNSISWHASDGKVNIAPIPKLMRKLTLSPYFQIMDVGDEVCFEE